MNLHQRRSTRRFVRIDCVVSRERDGLRIGERTLDLSADGMQIMTGSRVLTGEPVFVSFQIPATREWFDAEGYVARVVHGRRPGDQGRCLGIVFSEFEPRIHSLLGSVLRNLPQPLPRRRVRAA
jgi:hypothetical protein